MEDLYSDTIKRLKREREDLKIMAYLINTKVFTYIDFTIDERIQNLKFKRILTH